MSKDSPGPNFSIKLSEITAKVKVKRDLMLSNLKQSDSIVDIGTAGQRLIL
jgi:hypothetical protein